MLVIAHTMTKADINVQSARKDTEVGISLMEVSG